MVLKPLQKTPVFAIVMVFLRQGFVRLFVNKNSMAKKLYEVLSPDGFPITCEPFKTKKAALEYIPRWCERYQSQGYYSTARRDQIPLADLPACLRLVSFTDWF
jgi:hypothetical protein